MLNDTLILTNVANKNTFQLTNSITLVPGTNPALIYLQLYQSDLKLRFIPEAGSTVTLSFLRGNTVSTSSNQQNETVSTEMDLAFPEDQSIWKCELSDTDIDKIVAGGILLTIEQPTQGTLKVFKRMVVRKATDPAEL